MEDVWASSKAANEPMGDDDPLIRGMVAARILSQSQMTLAMGTGAVALSTIPLFGIPLPTPIYALFCFGPMVLGIVSVAGTVLVTKSVARPPGEVMLSPAQRSFPLVLTAIGGLLGAVGTAMGLTNFVMMQMTTI